MLSSQQRRAPNRPEPSSCCEAFEEILGQRHASFGSQLGEGDPTANRNPAPAPHMQRLWGKAERAGNPLFPHAVYKVAVGVSYACHAKGIHAMLMTCNPVMLIAPLRPLSFTVRMKDVAERIRQRYEELDLKQAEVARASGLSTARFGNYCSGSRTPDIFTLARIARALQTTTDWLLGLSEEPERDVYGVVSRLLELEGMSHDRVVVIAQAAQEALRLLNVLPDSSANSEKASLAAQAVWRLKRPSKPN